MHFQAHTLVAGNVHVLPVLHGELELAQLVVEAFRRLRPAAVAVELPRTLERPLLQATRRLPQISGVRYRNARNQAVYFLVEPTEPLFEGARLALEHGLPVHCVDLDLDDYPDHADALPDAYAILRIGHRRYFEAVQASAHATAEGPEDTRREAAMAARLTRLARDCDGPVLFLCGMAHAARIAALVGRADADPLDRASRSGVTVFNVHPESCREVLSCWGYLGRPTSGRAPRRSAATSRGRPARPRRPG